MFPSTLTGVYTIPAEYKSPLVVDENVSPVLKKTNVADLPNLNSADYRRQPIERTLKMHPVWERIAVNSKNQVLIATNKCTGREWCSTMYAFDNVNAIEPKKAVFRSQIDSLVTNVTYTSEKIILGTFRNGGVRLSSTYSEKRNPKSPNNLYMISEKFEHFRPIDCLEKIGEFRAITGSQEGLLKVWDMGEADLRSVNTYRFAHLDAITGIAACQSNDSSFATASRDKSILMWDIRQPLPATGLYDKYTVAFKDLIWDESPLVNCNTHLWIGDEAGKLHLLDIRKPGEFLHSEKIFIRPFRKIAFKNDCIAMIGNLNLVKIYSVPLKKVVYENDSHQHFVRDCCWYDSKRLLTVGCDGKMFSHYVFQLKKT